MIFQCYITVVMSRNTLQSMSTNDCSEVLIVFLRTHPHQHDHINIGYIYIGLFDTAEPISSVFGLFVTEMSLMMKPHPLSALY